MSLKEVNFKVLVVGIGNPLRGDDGVGSYVADCIEAQGLSGVHVWITQQLQVEDLERMLVFSQVILVDASVDGLPLDFRCVDKNQGQLLVSSHHCSAEMFVHLARSIYQKDLDMRVCSIRGHSFEVGQEISPDVHRHACEAVVLITDLLKRQAHA